MPGNRLGVSMRSGPPGAKEAGGEEMPSLGHPRRVPANMHTVTFYLEIAVLALIQGAAELLPVSSSAHVILAARLMGRDPSSPSMVFLLIMLHTGTMFAAIVYFWSSWKATLFPPQGLS